MSADRSQWAMQLVARVEKVDPPEVADICAAAAQAVTALISDERAVDGGEWSEALTAWQEEGRIRKLVRRARGANWKRAQEPAGATRVVESAAVRAYVPCPMDQIPAPLTKLQIQSSPLPPAPPTSEVPEPTGHTAMLIALTPDPPMSWGKQGAQSAHAAQVLWRSTEVAIHETWVGAGSPVTVLHPDAELWERLCSESPAGSIEIRDGGFTEVAPGTHTAVAWWS